MVPAPWSGPRKMARYVSPSIPFSVPSFSPSIEGYGATTLPALTEAITEEKGDAQVEYAVNRLVELIDKLAENIKP